MSRTKLVDKTGAPYDADNPIPMTLPAGSIIVSGDLDVRPLDATTDTINVAMDGVIVDETHPLAMMVPGHVAVEGGNTEDVIVSLDSEQVSLAETYEGGTAVDATPPKGIVAMMIKGGYYVPINDLGNSLPVVMIPPNPISAIIANGESVSSAIDIAGAISLGIEMPAAFTGTTLTFLGSSTVDGTYKPIMSMGYEVSTPCAANQIVSLGEFLPHLSMCRYIKIRSGTGASPTAEAAERQLYVIVK